MNACRAIRRISGKNLYSSGWLNTSAVGKVRNGSAPMMGLAGLNSLICAPPSSYCMYGSSATSGLPFQSLSLVLR